jgi:hypothetical protein
MVNGAASSPIRPLIKYLAASPYSLASERSDELKSIVDTYGINIEFVEDDR